VAAHLMGSINERDPDEPFPSYADVDVSVVLEAADDRENGELLHEGLMLEIGYRSRAAYASPQQILADPVLAPHLARNSILADPESLLTPLQEAVAAAYTRETWVAARVAQEQAWLATMLEKPWRQFDDLLFTLLYLSALIATASLAIPTHRRTLVLLHDLLATRGRLDLHEEALTLLGAASLDVAAVEAHLASLAQAFARATAVTTTPFPGSFKLHAHLLPYVVDATQAMITAGYHREAMIWIAGLFFVSNTALQLDAPPAERPTHQARFDRVLAALALNKDGAWQARRAQARRLARQMEALAGEIVSSNPAIVR
jgi:hypothetical protein